MKKDKFGKEETACLTETQLEHIIDAARDEPGACPKAKRFVNELRPRKRAKEDSPALNVLEKALSRKVKGVLNTISSWF